MLPQNYKYFNQGVSAASATYRKAKQHIEKSLLGFVLPNTKYPSEDFQETVEYISDLTDRKLLNAYETGLNRGLKQVLVWLTDGTLVVHNNEVTVNNPLTVKIKRRKADGSYETLEYEFEPEDIGLHKIS